MSKLIWVKLDEAFGRMEAEIVKSYLEANDIPVQLIMGTADQLYAPGFGLVEILVPSANLVEAQKLMGEFGEIESS